MTTGFEIRCSKSCCDRSKNLGEISSTEGIFKVVARQHGVPHTGTVTAKQILFMLSGTVESSAIFIWMRGVLVGGD